MSKLSREVTVVIVNWNAGETLDKCLIALQKQVEKPKQVIVVDNASSDGSVNELENRYPDVDLIKLENNAGFAAANNRAIRKAEGSQWVALLNPDAFPEPEWLQNLLDAAERNPEYSFFASRLLKAGNLEMLDGAGDIYHVSGLVWRRGHGLAAANNGCFTEEIFSPCAAAAMYKTQDFLAAGGFDEGYFCYSEDSDLGFRLRLKGLRCLYVSDAVVWHVGSATTLRHSDFQIYHGHRNLVWTFMKNMPWPLLLLYLPQHLLMNILTVLLFTLKGRGGVIIKAKFDAIKGLPDIIRQRKEIQKRRKTGSLSLWRVMTKGLFRPYFKRG